MHTIPTVLAAAALGAALLPTTQDPERSVRKTSAPTLVIEAGEYDVADLIAQAARFLKRNDLLSPEEFKTRRGASQMIALNEPLSLKHDECDEVIGQLAITCDLVRVPLHESKGVHMWVSTNGNNRGKLRSRAAVMTPEQVRAKRRSAVSVLTTVSLEHVSAHTASRSLAPIFSTSRYTGFSMSHAGNSVVITGLADQVANAIDVLREIDQPLKNPEPKWQQRVDAMQAEIESLRAQVSRLQNAKK